MNLPNSIEKLEFQKTVDQIEIYSRDGICVFKKQLIGSQWNNSVSAKKAIEDERMRELFSEEVQNYKQDWFSVFEDMRDRSAPNIERKNVEGIADELIKKLEPD